MSSATKRTIIFGVAALVGGAIAARAQHHHGTEGDGKSTESKLATPSSLVEEHRHLHERLEALTNQSGEIGTAAKRVAELLHEHFGAEDRLAMPLIGLLQPLAYHESIDREAPKAMEMAKEFRMQLPAMLNEHKAIKKALDDLRAAATHVGDLEAIAFADALMLHARNEEEVLYPAALLVGDAVDAAHSHH